MSKKSKRVFPNSTADAFHVEGDVKIVKASVEHAGYLQHHLRPADIRECMIHGATPWRALHIPLRYDDGETYTALYKDEPVCMFGVVGVGYEDGFSYGNIWMLGSHVIDKHKKKFVRISRDMCDYLCERFDLVENVVPIDHIATIKWLDSMGFAFSETPVVINGFECLRFVRCLNAYEVRFE